MTDQPTTWTPERALAMLRDWRDAKSYSSFSSKWGNPDRGRVAFEALESAAAEIERQKARADAAERERDGWRREESKCVRVARDTLGSDAPAHLSTIADCVVSLGALVERLRAELAKIRGRDAKPFDWDGVPTVEEWIEENLREREPRAGSAMVELHPDEVVADRGESRRVAGWLKDLLAESGKLRAELAAKHPAEAAQQGPSDEEIAYALGNDIQGPVLRKVLRMIARRAGVKL